MESYFTSEAYDNFDLSTGKLKSILNFSATI